MKTSQNVVDTNTLKQILALELARQGKHERDALFIATDPKRKAERDALLASARNRKGEAEAA